MSAGHLLNVESLWVSLDRSDSSHVYLLQAGWAIVPGSPEHSHPLKFTSRAASRRDAKVVEPHAWIACSSFYSVGVFRLVENNRTLSCASSVLLSTHCRCFCIINAISEGNILHIVTSCGKLTIIIRQIGQQWVVAALSRMQECSGITGKFVRARV